MGEQVTVGTYGMEEEPGSAVSPGDGEGKVGVCGKHDEFRSNWRIGLTGAWRRRMRLSFPTWAWEVGSLVPDTVYL